MSLIGLVPDVLKGTLGIRRKGVAKQVRVVIYTYRFIIPRRDPKDKMVYGSDIIFGNCLGPVQRIQVLVRAILFLA